MLPIQQNLCQDLAVWMFYAVRIKCVHVVMMHTSAMCREKGDPSDLLVGAFKVSLS